MLNAERPTRIVLHGPLADEFGAEHRLYVASPGEAVRALCCTRKGFRERVSEPGASYSILVGDRPIPMEGLKLCTGTEDLHIVPVVEGGKDSTDQILIGAVLVVASFYMPASWGFLSSAAFGMGSGMVIGGIAQMLSPAPGIDKPAERPENKPSAIFNGPVNTISQEHPIQILYGEMEVGSAVIATMIDNSDDTGAVVADMGLDFATLVTLAGGSTLAMSSVTVSSSVLLTLVDGTTLEKAPNTIVHGFTTPYTIVAGGNTIVLGQNDSILNAAGNAIQAAGITVGDELLGGMTVSSTTRELRRELIAMTFMSELDPFNPDPDYPDDPTKEIRYFTANGFAIPASLDYPPSVIPSEG